MNNRPSLLKAMLKGDDIILMPAVWDGFSAKVVKAMLLISPEKQILSAGLMPMMASLFPAEPSDELPHADFSTNFSGKAVSRAPWVDTPGKDRRGPRNSATLWVVKVKATVVLRHEDLPGCNPAIP